MNSLIGQALSPPERVRLIVERTLAAEKAATLPHNPARGALDGIRIEPPDLAASARYGEMRQEQIAAALLYMKGR